MAHVSNCVRKPSVCDFSVPAMFLRLLLMSICVVGVMPLQLATIEPFFNCQTSAPADECKRVCNTSKLSLECPHIRLEMSVKLYLWDIVLSCTRNYSDNIERLPQMQLGSSDQAQALLRNCPLTLLSRFGNLNVSVIEVVIDDPDSRRITHGHMDAEKTPFYYLDITNSTAEAIDEDALRTMPSLMALTLLNTTFRSLPANLLQRTAHLYHFSVFNDTALTTMSSGFFSNLPRLVEVYLIGCPLTSLPVDMFINATSLSTIIIRDNRLLNTLPVGIFDSTPHLIDLDLSYNALQYLEDGLFRSLEWLTSLNLEDNQLTQISP